MNPSATTAQRSQDRSSLQADRSGASRPTRREIVEGVEPLAVAPAFFGPPVIFLVGPWLLLVLLIIPPAAVLITLVLVFVVAAGALVALVGLLASPYLLVHHLRSRHSASRRRFAFVRRPAGSAPRVPLHSA